MTQKTQVEDWEKKAIWRLTLKFLFVGVLGTLLIFLVASGLISAGYGRYITTSATMLMIPWALVLVFGTSIAYHRGVVDEYIQVMGEKAMTENGEAPHPSIPAAWEQEKIQTLTIKHVIFAAIGTLSLIGLSHTLRNMGYTTIHPVLLFLPWVITWITEASSTYHQGVLDERIKVRGRRDSDRRLGARRGGK